MVTAVSIGLVSIGVPVAVASGDWIYSRIVNRRMRAWERSIRRDASGIREGGHAFTVGSGGQAVLLIHGFGDTPGIWRRLAESLSDQGLFCRAMRLPGFGVPAPEAAAYSLDHWLDAIDQEVQGLRAKYDTVWIAAHSLGSSLAANYVLSHPDRVDGLIMMAPLINVSSRRAPFMISTHLWHQVGRALLRFTHVVENVYPADLRSEEGRRLLQKNPFVHRSVYDRIFESIRRLQGRAAEVTCPLLMLLSPHDRVVCNRAALQFYLASSSSCRRLHYLPDAGHMIPIDRGWQDVSATAARFVHAQGT
jgi:alpha-beta hydrolase superfamily lysophospholipase